MTAKKSDDDTKVVDKRKVTMTSVSLNPDGSTATQEATDYVRPDQLDAYVSDARTRWQSVVVSDDADAGPGGYDGDTATLPHLEAGLTLQQHLHHTGVKDLADPSNPKVN